MSIEGVLLLALIVLSFVEGRNMMSIITEAKQYKKETEEQIKKMDEDINKRVEEIRRIIEDAT